MPSLHLIPDDIKDLYEVYEWRNACAVLSISYPAEWQDLLDVLRKYRLYKDDIDVPGGRKTKLADRLDWLFNQRGWRETSFDTRIQSQQFDHDPPAQHDPVSYDTPTHKVDVYKNRVGLELEWNNKDPFFDRDLNNFRLLFDLKVIDVGIIVTRADQLQQIFDQLGRGDSYGASTTHISKLLPRVEGGGAAGCPVLAFGMKSTLYVATPAPPDVNPPPKPKRKKRGARAAISSETEAAIQAPLAAAQPAPMETDNEEDEDES